MILEIILSRYTGVYTYNASAGTIGDLIRKDNWTQWTLDLYESEPIKMTYQCSDSEQPDAKLVPYSQSFTLPGTANNIKAFGYPQLLSSTKSYEDYTGAVINGNWQIEIQEAIIMQDGLEIEKGRLELINCKTKLGEIVEIEAAFYSSSISIFDEVKDKLVSELVYETPNMNYAEGITGAMINTSSDGVFYFGPTRCQGWALASPDWGFVEPTGNTDPSFNTTGNTNIWTTSPTGPTDTKVAGLRLGYNLLPYAYVRDVIKKIFSGSSKTLRSTFMDSAEFKSLLLLYYDRTKSGTNLNYRGYGLNPSSSGYYEDHYLGGQVRPTIINRIDAQTTSGYIPSGAAFDGGKLLEDRNGIWSTDLKTFVIPTAGTYTFRLKYLLNIRFGWDQLLNGQGGNCPAGTPQPNLYPHSTYPLLGPNSQIYIRRQNGTVYSTISLSGLSRQGSEVLSSPATYTKNGQTHYQWEQAYNGWTTPTDINITTTSDNEIFYLEIVCDSQRYQIAPIDALCNPFPVSERLYQEAFDVEIEDVSAIRPRWVQTLPPIPQSEFLKNIISHFNLYIDVAPDGAIIIEPRDTFYSSGTPLDWSDKIDTIPDRALSRGTGIKQVEMRMATTKSWLDDNAQKSSKQELEWGSQIITFNKGTEIKQHQSPFGSLCVYSANGFTSGARLKVVAPVGATASVVPIPSLYSVDSNGVRQWIDTSDTYLAFNNGMYVNPSLLSNTLGVTGPAVYSWASGTSVIQRVNGAANAPAIQMITPWSKINRTSTNAIDLHYKTSPQTVFSGTYTPESVLNSSNAYTKYWKDFFTDAQNQKKYTLNIILNNKDMANFSLRDRVYIEEPNGDTSWFIVNKLDYEWGNPKSNIIELLKI